MLFQEGICVFVQVIIEQKFSRLGRQKELFANDQVLYTSSSLEDAERQLLRITSRLDEFLASIDVVQKYRQAHR